MTGQRTDTLLNSALLLRILSRNHEQFCMQEDLAEEVIMLSSILHCEHSSSPPHFAMAQNGSFSILHKIKLLLWGGWAFIFQSNLPPTTGSAWNSITTSSGRIDLRHWFFRCWIKAAGVRQIDPICRFVSQLLRYRNHFYIFQLLFCLAF